MDLGLVGKRAIVTGGTGGIGRACALELAKEKAYVCVTAPRAAPLSKVVKEIDAAGGRGLYVAEDLTSLEGCKKVVDVCVQEFGGVDILINCAGRTKNAPVLELSTDVIDDALNLKLYGQLRMAQLVLPLMRKNFWGRIVNVSGMAAADPTPGNLAASITNISIHNMTRSLADEVIQDGILVNVICPCMVDTNRQRVRYKDRAERENRSLDEVMREVGKNLPIGRMAEPQEIGRVACFLASEACSFVSGTVVYMDGGRRKGTP